MELVLAPWLIKNFEISKNFLNIDNDKGEMLFDVVKFISAPYLTRIFTFSRLLNNTDFNKGVLPSSSNWLTSTPFWRKNSNILGLFWEEINNIGVSR